MTGTSIEHRTKTILSVLHVAFSLSIGFRGTEPSVHVLVCKTNMRGCGPLEEFLAYMLSIQS